MTIAEFQKLIHETYFDRDNERGMEGTFMWFVEEVGELSTSLRHETHAQQEAEFADVFAWLVSLASIAGVDMERAIRKYAEGCPACKGIPCTCSDKS